LETWSGFGGITNLYKRFMINPNSSIYIREREEFHSDKCGHCMSYVNDDGDCTDKFCSGHIPSTNNIMYLQDWKVNNKNLNK